MTAISETLIKLPLEILTPLALLLILLPVFKLFNDFRSGNRAHSRENLQQLVGFLEKYSEKKDKISAFSVEEAAQSRYRKPVSISEIEYFLGRDNAADLLYEYTQSKPYVAIQDGEIIFCGPASRIIKVFSYPLSLRELKGYLLYGLFFSIGLSPWTLGIKFGLNKPWMVVIFSTLFVIAAFYQANKTENLRGARKYVETLQ